MAILIIFHFIFRHNFIVIFQFNCKSLYSCSDFLSDIKMCLRISSYTRFKSEGTKSTNVLPQCILYIIVENVWINGKQGTLTLTAHSFKLSWNCILLYMLWKEEINKLFSFFWWPKHLRCPGNSKIPFVFYPFILLPCFLFQLYHRTSVTLDEKSW